MLGGMQVQYKLYKLTTLSLPYTHPYMEVQEKAFCLVHAFNMALGKHVFSGEAVLRHVHALENTLSTRIEQAAAAQSRPMPRLTLQQSYTTNMGNVSANIINHFLHRQTWNQENPYFLKVHLPRP
jgi:hypothetical protein